MITDNSAARLLTILETGKSISPKANAKSAWMMIFELKGDDPQVQSILMSNIGQVMLLPHETKIQVELYYPAQVSALTHTLSQIQLAFTQQNLSNSWATFINHIDNHCIDTLKMSAVLLEGKLETKTIEADKLSTFRDRVQELIGDTIASGMSKELIQFMVHYLQKILSAINNYLITGAMPILDAVEATLGHAVLDPDFKQHLTENENGKKVRDLLGDLANVVTIASGATAAATYLASTGFTLIGS